MDQNFYTTSLPELIEIQKNSFCWFLSKGLLEELIQFSSIFDITESLEIKVYTHEYKLRKPKLTPLNAKINNTNYTLKIYVPITLLKIKKNLKQKNYIEKIFDKQQVFLGEIPLMTDKGTFIVNGCERIIINQLIRSPGILYQKNKKKNQSLDYIYSGTVITRKGSWLTFELDSTNIIWVKFDKRYKIPIYKFLYSLNLTNEEIYTNINNSIFLSQSIKKFKKKFRKTTTVSHENLTKHNVILSQERIKELIDSQIMNNKYYDLGEVGRMKINKKFGLNITTKTRLLTPIDILKIIDYLIEFKLQNNEGDDIDSLENRQIRCVGDLLQLQVHIGFTRLKRIVSEKLTLSDLNTLKPYTLFSSKPLIRVMREFFGSSQLSQFMDEINPLSELTHKRRISALGPGGLSTEHVTFAARDIHPTQYGRLCPIETPEGQNAGLISSLACYAKLNKFGFIETPFLKVTNGKIEWNTPFIFLTAEQERFFKIASADIPVTSNNDFIINDLIPIRYNNKFHLVSADQIDLVTISSIQLFSIATALIPFLEHNDANRALMGSNMQRQAVPLIYSQKPIVGTGLELFVAWNSGKGVISRTDGKVNKVTGDEIIIKNITKKSLLPTYTKYKLEKYQRSNQDTCINQKPIVWPGQEVKSGQILADGSGILNGELALGQNLLIAYMPWEGYNYEDAILVSHRVLSDNLFTSIHIERYELEIKQIRAGREQLTKNIPNVNKQELNHLDKNGIVKEGTFVKPYEVLIGKITPKENSDQLPEGKLLKALFGEKIPNVRDTSLRMPKGISGRVLKILKFSKEIENEKNIPVEKIILIQVFIAQIRKIQIGDKIAGRHGNKGVISKIMAIEDMPYLPDGTLIDLILNPLGVPSRMNVGQIFECLLGLAGDNLNYHFRILPFDEMYGYESSRILINNKLKEASLVSNKPWLFNPNYPGKIFLTDGRTGEKFDNAILIGKSYILKLVHLVDDKIHARATGPYSLITQQPIGGKSLQGGQRFGEMEVWALEAFGAAYTLQELLTLKSDDIKGRNQVINSIICGQPIPKPGIPESFKVLLRELQGLGLDINSYKLKRLEKGYIEDNEINFFSN